MTRFRAFFSAITSTALLLTFGSAVATESVIDLTGTNSKEDGACLVAIAGFFLPDGNQPGSDPDDTGNSDCTYDASDPAGLAGAFGPMYPARDRWIGPIFSAGYYAPGTSPFADSGEDPSSTPVTGDDKVPTALAAGSTLTIEDNGTPCDADDTITGSIGLNAATRNGSGGGPGEVLEESWGDGGVIYNLPVTTVTSAAANGSGGCDYEVASKGFPGILQKDGADFYPNDVNTTGQFNFYDDDANIAMASWNPGPDTAGPGDPCAPKGSGGCDGTGNIGFTDVTVTTDGSYSCRTGGATDCAPDALSLQGVRAILENALLTLSTDSSGNVTSGIAFINDESTVLNVQRLDENAWDGSRVDFTGTCNNCSVDPVANDIAFPSVLVNTSTAPLAISTANFTDPVTVSITLQGALGMATVNGSPGNAADITITYAAGALEGDDSFTYQVMSGAELDTATGTVTVTPDLMPVAPSGDAPTPDEGSTRGSGNVVTTFDVGSDLGNNGVVTITTQPASGQATVSGSIITYTSDGTPGTFTIDYNITDDQGDMADGTVSATITDYDPASPTSTTTAEVGAGETDVVIDVSGDVTPGNGAVDAHTFAVSTDPENGSAAFGSPIVTYTPDAQFVTDGGGEDCFSYTLTDIDGDVSAPAEICVTVAGAVVNPPSTGLPGGSSAVDLWTLSMLLGLPLLRRRRMS